MAYRNKTYVCFDADTDIGCYNLMKAWKANDNIEFDFHNAHELNSIRDSYPESTIKKLLKERLYNTKVLIVLIGEKTKFHYKYVRWEIEVAKELDIPIIAVNLNKERQSDDTLCPAILRDSLVIHVAYGINIVQYAIDHWPDRYFELKKKGETKPRHYVDSVYTSLGY